MAAKKIVFVIVEGPSDDAALGTLLDKIYDDNQVFVHIVHGDITTESGTNSGNILKKIGEIVNQYKRSNHFKTNDFKEIVHIVDMDGTYIPDEAIREDLEIKKPIYSETEIITKDVDGLKKRNSVKRQCLNKLSTTNIMCSSIPYKVYYMSCNLDHALYGCLNISDAEKEKKAHEFAKRYKDDLNGFIEYMTKSDFAVCDEYLASWDFIKQDKHSLHRHSNFGICIQSAMKKDIE